MGWGEPHTAAADAALHAALDRVEVAPGPLADRVLALVADHEALLERVDEACGCI